MGAWAKWACLAVITLSTVVVDASAAWAQRGPITGDRLTLYSQPGFRGRRVTLVRNEPDLRRVGFNNQAQSLDARGRWRVCDQIQYRGRCQTVRGGRPQIMRIGRRISSARFEGL